MSNDATEILNILRYHQEEIGRYLNHHLKNQDQAWHSAKDIMDALVNTIQLIQDSRSKPSDIKLALEDLKSVYLDAGQVVMGKRLSIQEMEDSLKQDKWSNCFTFFAGEKSLKDLVFEFQENENQLRNFIPKALAG